MLSFMKSSKWILGTYLCPYFNAYNYKVLSPCFFSLCLFPSLALLSVEHRPLLVVIPATAPADIAAIWSGKHIEKPKSPYLCNRLCLHSSLIQMRFNIGTFFGHFPAFFSNNSLTRIMLNTSCKIMEAKKKRPL